MKLDKLTVNVRPLRSFQAIDLGTMMARHWYLSLWSLWWQRMLPILIVVIIGFAIKIWLLSSVSDAWIFVVWFLFWWLKPYAEVPMVIFLSQKLFDNQYNTQKAWQQTKALSSGFSVNLLTNYRLSLRRQMLMPIFILEQQSKKQTKQRLAILSQLQNNAISWHTIVFSFLEFCLYIGVIILILQLIPQDMFVNEQLETLLNDMPFWLDMLLLLIYLFIISILSPFYIAGGFGLYICKRSLLEGWDIELKFRKLAGRVANIRQSREEVS